MWGAKAHRQGNQPVEPTSYPMSLTPKTDKQSYKAYRDAVVACDALWEIMMSEDGMEICGGRDGWNKLCEARDAMRTECTRRLNVWISEIT